MHMRSHVHILIYCTHTHTHTRHANIMLQNPAIHFAHYLHLQYYALKFCYYARMMGSKYSLNYIASARFHSGLAATLLFLHRSERVGTFSRNISSSLSVQEVSVASSPALETLLVRPLRAGSLCSAI